MLAIVGVRLEEISDGNRAAVLALRVAPGQEQFVSSVPESLAEAAEYPHARPWYRAIVVDGTPVGFVMVSWNAEPDPPEIIGPWFLWKLLIDERYQRRGYGAEVVTQIAAANKALEQVGFLLVSAGLTWCLENPKRSAAAGYDVSDVQKMFLKLA